jgi:DNA polymerase III subunit delta
MKVYPEKLAGQLKQKIMPVYVVSGDEPLLVQETCDEIRSALRSQGFTERDLFHVEAGFDWQEVLYSGNSMSLFAEKKIIELRMASAKPGDKGGKALQELIANTSEDNCLLIVLPRVDASTQRTKWFKSLESAGALIQLWPVDADRLPGWIGKRFKQAGLRASPDAVHALADKIEGNLLAAVQEIARLQLCAVNDEVSIDDVVSGVADSARYDVFLLIDSALSGDVQRVVKIVEGLKLEGVEPLYLNSMLAREIRNLVSMSFRLSHGQSVESVLKSGRIWDKRKRPVTACLKRNNVAALEHLQLRLNRVDRMVKGLEHGQPWDELTATVVALAS